MDKNNDVLIDDTDTLRGEGIDIVATGSITYTGALQTDLVLGVGNDIGQPQFAAPDPFTISPEILATYIVREVERFHSSSDNANHKLNPPIAPASAPPRTTTMNKMMIPIVKCCSSNKSATDSSKPLIKTAPITTTPITKPNPYPTAVISAAFRCFR